MSGRQIAVFISMIVFFVLMLFALGSWVMLSTQLDLKHKTLDQLGKDVGKQELLFDKLRTQADKAKETAETMDGEARQAKLDCEESDRSAKVRYTKMEKPVAEAWESSKAAWTKTYTDWRRRNKEIVEKRKRYDMQLVQFRAEEEAARKERDIQLKALNRRLRKITVEQKDWQGELRETQKKSEKVEDKIAAVTRNLERKRTIYPQGRLTFAAPDLKWVVVNLGYRAGVKTGMRFVVYSRRFADPVKKAEIVLTKVNALSSRAVLVPSRTKVLHDPQTGWETYDESLRYSPYSVVQGDRGEGLPQELKPYTTKRELVRRIRIERLKREEGLTDDEAVKRVDAVAETGIPVVLNDTFDPVAAGDWVHSPDYIPITSKKEFRRNVQQEIAELRNVKLGALTFYFTPAVSPYRARFLKRLVRRNFCYVAETLVPEVDYVVTTPATINVGALETLLAEKKEGGEEEAEDVKRQRQTLAALKSALHVGSRIIAENRLESFFAKRKRKKELLKGKEVQPGRYVFFVAGETQRRSVRETRRWIEENGGVTLDSFDIKRTDYLVVGNKADKYIKRAEKEGIKILREAELDHFFGRGK